MKIEQLRFNDLTDAEKESEDISNNGSGKEYAGYIKITYPEETIIYSDAMEPEDAIFSRDLGWVSYAIQKAYDQGLKDGKQ